LHLIFRQPGQQLPVNDPGKKGLREIQTETILTESKQLCGFS